MFIEDKRRDVLQAIMVCSCAGLKVCRAALSKARVR